MEEYSPKLYHLQGKLNVLADAFSRLPRFDSNEAMVGKGCAPTSAPEPLKFSNLTDAELHEPAGLDDFELYDCLAYLPEMDDYFDSVNSLLNLPNSDDNPLSYVWLRDMQERDPELMARSQEPDSGFQTRIFDDHEIICYTEKDKNPESDWKICLTDESVDHAIKYFHQLFNHPGHKQLLDGMSRKFHPELRQKIETSTVKLIKNSKLTPGTMDCCLQVMYERLHGNK